MAKLTMAEAHAMLSPASQMEYYEILFGLATDNRIDYDTFLAAVDAVNTSLRTDLGAALELCDMAAEFILCEHADHAERHYDELCAAVESWVDYEDKATNAEVLN